MQRTSISPEKRPTESQIIQSKPVKKKLVEHISKGELDLIQFFFEDIPKVPFFYIIYNDSIKIIIKK